MIVYMFFVKSYKYNTFWHLLCDYNGNLSESYLPYFAVLRVDRLAEAILAKFLLR